MSDKFMAKALGMTANEASSDSDMDTLLKNMSTVSETTNLKIDLITDRFIELNIKTMDMLPVTNPSPFRGQNIASPDGIFSPLIFGTTPNEQKRRYGYINLNCKVFHPYVYEMLVKLNQKIKIVCQGRSSWKIENGNLVEVIDGEDGYNPDNTGIAWLEEHFDELEFRKNASHSRNERVSLITNLKKDELFISKWLVIPIFYRDIQITNGVPVTPEIDKMYNDVIMYASQLTRTALPDQMHNTKWKLLESLVTIRKYGQQLIEKKNGFFKKNVLGKNVDYGFRSVISVHDIQNIDKPADDPIDSEYTGIPLSECCVLAFPFVVRELQEILRQELDSLGGRLPKYDKNMNFIGYDELADPMDKFTTDYLQKKINLYINTPGARFRPIHIRSKEGKTLTLRYVGRPYGADPKNKNANKIGNRVLTWTDLIYIAAVHACNDKHVYITRYPLNDYFGTFPTRIHVLSTVKTEDQVVNGERFKWYPSIDPSLPEARVSMLFNDTITMCNTYLKGLNGDYDGDQVTAKVVFTQEANTEAEEIMHSKRHFINIAGGAMRTIGNEATLTMYTLTMDPRSNSKPLADNLKKELISLDPEKLSVSWFTKNCTEHGTSNGMVPARYNINARVHLNKGEYLNDKELDTTAGRIIFNKLCIEGKIDRVTGFVNIPFTKKGFNGFCNSLADAIMEDKLMTKEYANFIHYYSFYGLKLCSSISPSFDENLLKPNPKVIAYKDKRVKEIEAMTDLTPEQKVKAYSDLEKELTDMAKGYIKDDPSMILFDSGSRGNFDVEYKVMSIMGGLTPNPATGGHDFMKSNYMDGLNKEDIPKAGNIVVGASYPRSVATAVGGYKTKQFYSVYQSLVTDEAGTNCGSKFTLPVLLTPQMAHLYMYQYMSENGKNICLTPENKDKYLGKVVHFRTPMGCLNDKICHVCAGDRFRRLDIENAGLTTGRISNSVMD